MTGTPAPGFRAVRLDGDGGVRIEERPRVALGDGELRIRPTLVGLCATDREIRDGTMTYFRTGMASYPVTPGHEWTGRVVGVGAGVEGFAVGDRVVGECSLGDGTCRFCREGRYHLCPDRAETGFMGQDGALAEELVFPARAAHLVPPSVSDDDAVLVEPTAIAYTALQRAEVGRDDALLVVGAGPIGLLVAACAVASGVRSVTVADPSAFRLEAAGRLGVHETIVAGDGALPASHWSRIIEASGSAAGLSSALVAARAGALIVCVSLFGADAVPIDVDGIVTRDVRLQGSLGSPGQWPAVLELLSEGRLHPSALITGRYPLPSAAAAFDRVGRPDQIKTVIEVDPVD